MLYPSLTYAVKSSQVEPGETIGVTVEQGDDDGDISCPGNLAPRAQCSELRENGTVIGRRSSTTFGEVTTLEVVLRRDGGTVYGATANALDEKWGRTSPASAELPSLTLGPPEDRLRNDAW